MESRKLVDYFRDDETRIEDLDAQTNDTIPEICLSSDEENDPKVGKSRVTSSCSTELIEKKRQLYSKGRVVRYINVDGRRTPIKVSPIKAKECMHPSSLRHYRNNRRFMVHWVTSWRILPILCSKYKVSYDFITYEKSNQELNDYVLAIPSLGLYTTCTDFDIQWAKKTLIKQLHKIYVSKLY